MSTQGAWENATDQRASVRFRDFGRETVMQGLIRAVCARTLSEVRPCLEDLRREVARGRWAAGFLAYEAAPAFDPALSTHDQVACPLPLLWFGVFEGRSEHEPQEITGSSAEAFRIGPWRPLVSRSDYLSGVERIRNLIAAGETYQVNYSLPLEASFDGCPDAWFRHLCAAQPTAFGAIITLGDTAVVSVSPELFFRLDGDRVVTRPMKGTAARGRWREEDEQQQRAMTACEKTRAENLMIVDLLRNDLGRVARTGSVAVEALFTPEKYPTVWQMTSTISARTDAGVPELLAALFPCGSVTGAPKVRTMEIIRRLEPHPRGVYCGAIGWWGPGRCAQFSVGIRTAVIRRSRATARYHVGAGIVWDSDAAAEHDECLRKAAVVKVSPQPDFELIETLRYDPAGWQPDWPAGLDAPAVPMSHGYAYLEQHLARLAASADYFGFSFDPHALRAALGAADWTRRPAPARVRIRLRRNGDFGLSADPLPPPRPWRAALAAEPVDDRDIFLFHKTTRRGAYDTARRQHPDADEVLLRNRRGELTEGTITNLLVRLDGCWLTPSRRCGLLAGVAREWLLALGLAAEAVLREPDLRRAECAGLINSVRGWIPMSLENHK
jgi:para-aminobenzoate synthetase/4-amino-4-deoxychorismate lyase